MRTKIGSVVLVNAVAFVTNMLFVFFLPDSNLSLVIGAMALSALVSGSTVSNNTAKVLSKIAAKEDIGAISQDSLTLFVYEQLVASIIVTCFLLLQGDWLPELHPIELVFLILLSSTGALVAFARVTDQFFILFNLVRAASTIVRLVSVFWLVSFSAGDWIPLALIATLALPMSVALYFVICSRSIDADLHSESKHQPLLLLREYLWGLPVAASRAFMRHGVLLASIKLLSPDELRMFRFLLLPTDAFRKVFNAFLPLFFDRMFRYSILLLPSVIIVAFAILLSSAWYFFGQAYLGFGGEAAGSFIFYVILNLTVYSVLPIAWRKIHNNKAMHTTLVVCTSVAVSLAFFWLALPNTVHGIFTMLSIYTLSYIVGMLILSRSEKSFG